MTILCENIKCKYCQHHSLYEYICKYGEGVIIDKNKKCKVYEKDTPENIKLAKFNKLKE